MNKKHSFLLQLAMSIAYILMIAVNYLAVRLPINGITTQEVSAKYPNLFAPAGITFAIWGLIYILLLLFVIFSISVLRHPKEAERLNLFRIGWLFVGTCLLNGAWLFAWHYEYILLSVIIMLTLLYLLIKIYFSIPKELGTAERLFLKLPFSIYLGWISIAAAANITTFLVSVNWNRFGLSEEFWTVLLMLLAAALGYVFIWLYNDIAYALVIAWALLGILIRHRTDFSGQYPFIQVAAYFGIGILLANSVYRLWLNRKSRMQQL